ncbi:MAG: hypothetical protein CL768_01920 [Chloroflexi bacterium]|nr:hypothetical protein [Chloroflexota bacterium]
MHIIHFSDVHIGVENYSKPNPQTGLSTRLKDFLDTFDELVDFSINEDVDLVVFSGDAYKNRDPNQTQQREFAKRIMRLAQAKIPVFLLSGNHDVPQVFERASSLEIYKTLEIQNVYTADTLDIHNIDTKNGPIQILALPWIRKSNLLAQRVNLEGKSHEEVNLQIQKTIDASIQQMALKLDPKVPAICSAHVTIFESVTSSEVSMMLGSDHGLYTNQLALPCFDYIALGHIHKHQVLNQKPLMVYSGSLQRVDFGEEKDTKGFCSIILDPKADVGNRIKDFKFIDVNARKFKTISVSIPDKELNPTKTIIEKIDSEPIEDSIVKLDISASSDLDAMIDYSAVKNALNKSYYLVSINKNISEQTRNRIGDIEQNHLSPLQALELYFKSRELSEDRIEKLLKHASEIINQHNTEPDQ